MPITRSQGRAPEAWTVDVDRSRSTTAIRHQLPPRSPSTTEGVEQPQLQPRPVSPRGSEDVPVTTQPIEKEQLEQEAATESTDRLEGTSDRTVKPSHWTVKQPKKALNKTYSRTLPMTTRGDARNEHRRPPSTANRSTRTNSKISRARENLLKIRLELAQIALQRAEEEDSDGYMDDRNSNEEYVRSWLEEAPEPEPTKEDNAAEGDNRNRSRVQQDPVVDVNSIADLRAQPSSNPTENEVKNTEATKPIEDTKGEGSLRSFITELTSAIASLADKKTEPWTSNSPSASKVIMTLPNFSGAHTEWLSFQAIYETTRRYFNDIENTARLRRSLQGRALETVSSELIGHARPDDIMKELELQFGRPDSIAQAETDRLRGLPRCSESPKDICTFASRVRSGIVTLRALKKEHYLINAELMRLLTEKLPNSLRVQWYRTYTEKHLSLPDLALFSDFVTEQARFCSAFAPPENIGETTASKRVTQRTHTATDKTAPKCRVCDREGHQATDCSKFKEGSSDKRWELAKKLNLCFRCLRSRRSGHTCRPKKCDVKGCTAKHHRLLHYNKKPAAEGVDRPAAPEQKKEAKETVASSHTTSSQAYLKMVPVRVVGPAGEVSTFALLDDGSTVSLIDEDIAKQVGAEGPIDPLKIGAIGDTMIDTPCSRRITITLASSFKSKVPFRARTIPKLNLSTQTVSEEDVANCKHLDDLRHQLIYDTGAPKILIGQDNWHLLLASEIRRGPKHQPVASLTTMGWTLHGAHTRILGQQVHYVNRLTSNDEDLDEQLREFFALESLVINPRRPDSDPEKKAEDILSRHTQQLEDGHIETAMLWKNENSEMPDSYGTALKRLVSIEKKLDSNPALRDRYVEQMDSLTQKGYAEKAPKASTPGRTWYLPHFDVFNPMKPDKLRIVHDAAAKSRGLSLNDFLLTGPDLLQSLPGVMMRFRRHRIAISGDIAEMFMQVKVRAQDRDALRYLWRGNRREGAPDEYRMKSIIFGAASSPCTAIFAKNWNAKRHIDEHPEAVEAIIRNHYMDDYLDSYRSEEEATRIATTVKNIHLQAKFELRKWVSNSARVIENIDPTQARTEVVSIGKIEAEKILAQVVQQQSFALEIARLQEEKTLEKDSRLRPLQIEIIDNVIRLRSRISATSEVADDVKRPPILHGDHHIKQRYIDWTHRSLQHSGRVHRSRQTARNCGGDHKYSPTCSGAAGSESTCRSSKTGGSLTAAGPVCRWGTLSSSQTASCLATHGREAA